MSWVKGIVAFEFIGFVLAIVLGAVNSLLHNMTYFEGVLSVLFNINFLGLVCLVAYFILKWCFE